MLELINTDTKTEISLKNPLLRKGNNINSFMFDLNSRIEFKITTTWNEPWHPTLDKQLYGYETYVNRENLESLKSSYNMTQKKYLDKLSKIEDKLKELEPDLDELFALKGSLITQDNIIRLKKKEKENKILEEEYLEKGIMNKAQKTNERFPENIEGEFTEIVLKNKTYVLKMVLTYNDISKKYIVRYKFSLNPDFLLGYQNLRVIENKYEEYEEAFKYFNGRLDFYKNKYFNKKQPKIDRKLLNQKSNYYTATHLPHERIGLKDY